MTARRAEVGTADADDHEVAGTGAQLFGSLPDTGKVRLQRQIEPPEEVVPATGGAEKALLGSESFLPDGSKFIGGRQRDECERNRK